MNDVQAIPGGDFKLFLTRLGYQAMLSLGLIENPVTGKAQREEAQARMILEDLRMLAHKTEGNLGIDEIEALTNLVRELERHLEPGE